MLQMLHHHPWPDRPVARTSVVMKWFERLVLAYLKASTGPLLDPLQFAYRANKSVDDAVNMGQHFCQGVEGMDEAKTQSLEEKGFY